MFRRTVRLLACTLLLALPALSARAEPTVKVDTHYYDIRGASAAELRQQMSRLGPPDRDGRRYDAYTKWYVAWRFTYHEDGKSCRIERVTTSADVTYTLPRWKVPRAAAPELTAHWDRYLAALQTHEDGHRDFGVRGAHEVEQQIRALPAHGSCRELEAAANAAGHRVLDKYRAQELAYDRDTRHGATQGAVFP